MHRIGETQLFLNIMKDGCFLDMHNADKQCNTNLFKEVVVRYYTVFFTCKWEYL